MTLSKKPFTELSEDQARRLSNPGSQSHAVEVKPSMKGTPATVEGFVQGILEIQRRFRVRNVSPTTVYELRRVGDELRLQFVVPTKRMERKVRTHLATEIPGIQFEEGSLSIPVQTGDTVGGGILTPGRDDKHPLRTEFTGDPPIDHVVGSLHRHAMRNNKIIIQILFQPVAGQPVRRWWWRRRSIQTADYLRKEKEKLWGTRSATPLEKSQAKAIEAKVKQRRFWTGIRFAVIGAGMFTPSRVKELAGGFNIFEPETGQHFNAVTITGRRQRPFLRFYQAVRDREFGGYSLRFQASMKELAGLLSIPSREQYDLDRLA